MRITLHIERLILDGLPVASWQGSQVQRAVEAELARLLAAGGLSEGLRRGASVPSVRAGTLSLARGSHPTRLGGDIARAVHEGIRGTQGRKALR